LVKFSFFFPPVQKSSDSCSYEKLAEIRKVMDRLTYGKYRIIHKSLRNFRHLRYSSRNGHAEGEHVHRGRDTPSFCPNFQVLDMSTLGDAADIYLIIKFLPHTCNVCDRNLITGLTSAAPLRVDISNTCKVEQKLGVSLPLLTCSPSA